MDKVKDKEKELEQVEWAESTRAPWKKGPEDGTRGSDGDTSEEEQARKSRQRSRKSPSCPRRS